MKNVVCLDSMKNQYKAHKKRKQYRYPACKGVYALLCRHGHQGFDQMGQLIDISSGGFSFHYIIDRKYLHEPISNNLCRLRIFGAFKMFELERCLVIYDNELTKYSSEPISVRRCGIKFERLSLTRKTEFERIIDISSRNAMDIV
jgi:hypothetical protein